MLGFGSQIATFSVRKQWSVFIKNYLSVIMNYFRDELHQPISTGSAVIAIEAKGSENFRRENAFFILGEENESI